MTVDTDAIESAVHDIKLWRAGMGHHDPDLVAISEERMNAALDRLAALLPVQR